MEDYIHGIRGHVVGAILLGLSVLGKVGCGHRLLGEATKNEQYAEREQAKKDMQIS
jgi:hypothetical protein